MLTLLDHPGANIINDWCVMIWPHNRNTEFPPETAPVSPVSGDQRKWSQETRDDTIAPSQSRRGRVWHVTRDSDQRDVTQ